jgi:hypothetical protein
MLGGNSLGTIMRHKSTFEVQVPGVVGGSADQAAAADEAWRETNPRGRSFEPLRPGVPSVANRGGHSQGRARNVHSARGPVSDLWGAKLRHGSVLPELRLTVGPGRRS